MISTEDMKKLDKEASVLGISPQLLMENAGKSIEVALSKRINLKDKRIAVVSGLGNNGGDGLCAARHLIPKSEEVIIFLYGEPGKIKTEEARRNWNILENIEANRNILRNGHDIPEFENFDIIIDALLGIGASGKLRGFLPKLIKKMNHSDAYKVAVDVPTGLNSESGEKLGNVFLADLTITFHDIKPGLKKAKEFAGEIEIAGIGIPF